jgi:hypothetical protein
VPAEGNALAQILLERGVNGESPMKRRSPRKSTTTRSTPKSARTAKVATKTPRTAPKRARKSTVVPDASAVDEPRGAPATKRTNKRPGTSTSKTPKAQSRPRKKVVEVEVDDGGGASIALARKCVGLNIPLPLPALTPTQHLIYAHLSCDGTRIDVDAAPPQDSTTSSRLHPALRPKSFEDRLADARAYICYSDIPKKLTPRAL